MDLMQPKWSRRHDLEVGHEAWRAYDDEVRAAVILAIDNDGHYTTVRHHADDSTRANFVRIFVLISWKLPQAVVSQKVLGVRL